jgi:hypothetical protein
MLYFPFASSSSPSANMYYLSFSSQHVTRTCPRKGEMTQASLDVASDVYRRAMKLYMRRRNASARDSKPLRKSHRRSPAVPRRPTPSLLSPATKQHAATPTSPVVHRFLSRTRDMQVGPSEQIDPQRYLSRTSPSTSFDASPLKLPLVTPSGPASASPSSCHVAVKLPPRKAWLRNVSVLHRRLSPALSWPTMDQYDVHPSEVAAAVRAHAVEYPIPLNLPSLFSRISVVGIYPASNWQAS